MSPLDTSRLRAEAVRIAKANIGYGEHNKHFLSAIGAKPNYEWCAIFAGYCYSKAAQNLKLHEPAWAYRRPGVPEPGAKRLVRQLGKAGSIWAPDGLFDDPRPGDLVCWHRGVLSWTGHVGIVVDVGEDTFRTVEGNVGRRVASKLHSYDEPKLYRFASLEP